MPDTTPTPRAPRGHVISQVETQGQDASGRFVDGVRVTGMLDDSGVTFSVFVPAAQFTPANVAAALEAKAAQVAAVHGITFGG